MPSTSKTYYRGDFDICESWYMQEVLVPIPYWIQLKFGGSQNLYKIWDCMGFGTCNSWVVQTLTVLLKKNEIENLGSDE